MPDRPEMALASMGIYAFATRVLIDQLRRDAERRARTGTSARISSHAGGARQSCVPPIPALLRALLQRS
jgi:hypothetical protein